MRVLGLGVCLDPIDVDQDSSVCFSSMTLGEFASVSRTAAVYELAATAGNLTIIRQTKR
jgi:hypothetical protein